MLDVREIHTYYGRSHILQGVSLDVRAGEIHTLLGRNGAGKTTILRSIIGLTAPRRGHVYFNDQEITKKRPHRIARRGIAFVGSGHRTFGGLTVDQNLALATRPSADPGGWTLPRVQELFPKLVQLRDRRASYLSGGEQQMVKLSMALLANPKLLLLDEPTEGLAPAVVQEMRTWVATLKEAGLSVLLCEQNALFALRLADRATIVEKGRIVYHGDADDLRNQDDMRVYLGI